MPEWSAEVVIDRPLARRLLEQFPELAVESLRPLAEGWDYAIWVVDETWAFRFPRRAIAVPGVEREIAVLPLLAPQLPLPVPEPVFVGRPADGFPWPFFGSALLPGRELGELPLDDEARTQLGQTLASFLRRLHGANVSIALPPDSNRRADMTIRVPKTRRQLGELEALALWHVPASVEKLLAEAERLPPAEHSSLVHGDLHARQLLVGDDAKLSGVIDWVDICCSDPAIDLSLYWSYLPPAGRRAFLEVYGAVTEAQLLRARVLALSLSAALASYGHVERAPTIEREALAGLERAAGAAE
jgi:aminoglycoside phosphotransferase (APT) family kinase protein